ncbi:MAG: class II glutamine amidotransferase [Nitrosotalea sp.]
MCLIIRTEKEKEIPREVMQNMYWRNDDGYGFMWIQNNKINAIKNQGGSLSELYEKYLELKEFNPFIHLRMRTHGEVNEENAHPYFCGYGIWLMHNGIINHNTIKYNDKRSDTWQFIDNILNPLFKQAKNPHTLIRSEMFKHVTEEFVGGGNRLVIGDRGGFIIMNEGIWHKVPDYVPGCAGILVSNTYAWSSSSFEPKKTDSEEWYQGQKPHITHNSYHSGTNVIVHNYQGNSEGLQPLFGTYWMGTGGDIWAFNGYGYLRRRDLDEFDTDELRELFVKYKEIPYNVEPKQRESIIILPSDNKKVNVASGEDVIVEFENSKPIIVINSKDEDDVSDEENLYKAIDLDFVCKEWSTYPKEDLETLLWTEPEECVRVLEHALRRY